jgi:hypothetical protein
VNRSPSPVRNFAAHSHNDMFGREIMIIFESVSEAMTAGYTIEYVILPVKECFLRA